MKLINDRLSVRVTPQQADFLNGLLESGAYTKATLGREALESFIINEKQKQISNTLLNFVSQLSGDQLTNNDKQELLKLVSLLSKELDNK